MTIIIRRLQDVETARALHDLAFPDDAWPGDDHIFWIARDTERENATAAFASALFHPEGQPKWGMPKPYVFLSRCAVIKRYQGQRLQCRLIQHRVLWAHFQGAEEVVTYSTLQNYASMVSLIRSGFKFHEPPKSYAAAVGKRFHFFHRSLE